MKREEKVNKIETAKGWHSIKNFIFTSILLFLRTPSQPLQSRKVISSLQITNFYLGRPN